MRSIVVAAVIAASFIAVFWVSEVSSDSPAVIDDLPLEYGDTRVIFQGNNGKMGHGDVWNRYAFDFSPMPEGSPVVAAADGVVTFVKEDTAGPTGNWRDNNEVVLQHADNNVSEYLHIKQNGAVAEVGQKVMRGDLIAYSGNTGKSGGPHLHFGLRKGHHFTGESVPCKFADVEGNGVPKEGDTVTSKNFPIRYEKECTQIEETVALYTLCSDLGSLDAVAKELKSLAKIKIPVPLTVLKKAIEERDRILGEYNKAAEEALDALTKAMEAKDTKTAVRLAYFGEKDFEESGKRADFQKAHRELKRDSAYKEALNSLKAEIDCRTKVTKAIKSEIQVNAKRKKDPKASYSSVIKSYEQALSLAPEGKTAENLKKHIEDLKTK